MSTLTDVIQHPKEAVDNIDSLVARVAELEGALQKIAYHDRSSNPRDWINNYYEVKNIALDAVKK